MWSLFFFFFFLLAKGFTIRKKNSLQSFLIFLFFFSFFLFFFFLFAFIPSCAQAGGKKNPLFPQTFSRELSRSKVSFHRHRSPFFPLFLFFFLSPSFIFNSTLKTKKEEPKNKIKRGEDALFEGGCWGCSSKN
jgi:hypothetical protein